MVADMFEWMFNSFDQFPANQIGFVSPMRMQNGGNQAPRIAIVW